MKFERWERLKAVFDSALQHEPGLRTEFLRRACGADETLRAEVEAMLARHADSRASLVSTVLQAEVQALARDLVGEGLPRGNSEPYTERLSAGTRLGPYEIIAAIGAGGMGEVYRAHDGRLERDIAIKVLPAGRFSDPAARAGLLREARMASKLNHPHICIVHEVGEADGQAYIAMEFVEGQPLSSLLAGGAFPPQKVLHYGLQLADALAHAHERRVVHRDLKSANVVVTPEGWAKVLDFGLAKRLSGEELVEVTSPAHASLTEPGMLVGTLAYMAPEQLRGRQADVRSDVWALGVVLYEMAAGKRPFGGNTGFELSSAILTQRPAPLPRQIPAQLSAVVERCLEKEPSRRFQRGGEVHDALHALHSGEGVIPGRGLGRRPSLIVLPLQNLSGDSDQDYFVEGTHEALITDLAKISALRVIARSSSMRFKNTEKSLPEIARELNVDAVLTGSIVRSGNRVRITAQLLNPRTEEHLWAERYERELRDVLSLENEIVMAITREIRLQLTPQEQAQLASARPVNPEAYEAYLKGRFHWYKLSRGELDTALEYFEVALAKDPQYAPAYVGIADVWGMRGDAGFLPFNEVAPRAKAAVLKALELDDTLADAHVSLANFMMMEWDWAAAEMEFRRAIDINPSHANAHFMYGDFLILLGRSEEWVVEIRRTLELDPLNFFFQCFYGWQLVYLGRYDEAVVQLRKVLATQPDFSSAHMGLWGALYKRTHYEEALAEAQKFFGVLGDSEICEALDHGRAEAGYCGAMKRAADALGVRSRHTHVPAVRIARLYAHAGEKEQALQWLERAYEQRESPLVHLGVGWDWDILRGDPRFQALLERMNFRAN